MKADSSKQPCDHLAIESGVREGAAARLRSIQGHVEGVLRMLERDDV